MSFWILALTASRWAFAEQDGVDDAPEVLLTITNSRGNLAPKFEHEKAREIGPRGARDKLGGTHALNSVRHKRTLPRRCSTDRRSRPRPLGGGACGTCSVWGRRSRLGHFSCIVRTACRMSAPYCSRVCSRFAPTRHRPRRHALRHSPHGWHPSRR